MKPIFVNIRDRKNLGDMLCGARALFPDHQGCEQLDFREVPDGRSPLIVGGGGMLHPGVDRWIYRQASMRSVMTLGIGVNYHDGVPSHWWHIIKPCTLRTVRDRKLTFQSKGQVDYCPCPTTAMIDWEEVRRTRTITGDTIVFSHFDRPIGAPFSQFPRLTNRWGESATLEGIAATLSRYQRVVTNSYHGALWGALAGCHIVIWQPFSNRFSTGLPYSCPSANIPGEMDAAWAVWDSPRYCHDVGRALNECPQLVRDHVDLIRQVI